MQAMDRNRVVVHVHRRNNSAADFRRAQAKACAFCFERNALRATMRRDELQPCGLGAPARERNEAFARRPDYVVGEL